MKIESAVVFGVAVPMIGALAEVLAPDLPGRDPRNLHPLIEAMNRLRPRLFDAKAAVGMACCNLLPRT